MTSPAAVLRFSAEFATFLVAIAGAALVLLRPHLLGVRGRARFALAVGFLAVATAAFLHGSLLLEAGDVAVVVLGGLGIVALALGTLGWGDDPPTRRVVWAALVLLAVAEAVSATATPAAVADATRVFGAVGLGAVLLSSARRSIPARVAISTAATLLVVVLAVSIALSVVISDNAEREALRRVDARAQAEAGEVDSTARPAALTSATLVAGSLQGRRLDLLQALSARPALSPVVADDIRSLADAGLLVSKGPVLYATDRQALIVFRDIDRAGAETLVGSRAVNEVLANLSTSSSVEVVGDRALAVGAAAVTASGPEGRRPVGVVVAADALDASYLNVRARTDPNVSLAVVDREHRLASFGRALPPAGALRVGRSALGRAGGASTIAGGSFVAARAVKAPDGTAVVAVVASTPTTVVDATRNSLFRTLFIVALVTALAAFLAALAVGERIGAGLQRLTVAAEGIQRGDFTSRVAATTQDELGVLGGAFDSMAGSIQALTTELRHTADEEARVRSRLEAVVGGMGEAVVAVDATGRVTTWNDAATELFGVPATTTAGLLVTDVVRVHGDDGVDLGPRLARPVAERWRTAAVVHRVDGVDVPVALSGGGLPGPSGDRAGDVAGGVYVLRDMRREREAERAKSELVSNISHELRTPLVPIKGYAMMLRRGRLQRAESRAALDAITEAADQLERVVGRLLEVAAGDARPERKEPVAVRALIDSVVERWKQREGGRHPITRRVARDLPPLLADGARLEESLDELVENAAKFSPDGSRILVSARLSDNGNRPAVELSVDDLGIGIAEDELGRIFDDFSQADSSPTRAVGGLGLGLGVVLRAVEAHDGELVCETEVGKGSRFAMILPIVPIQEGEGETRT